MKKILIVCTGNTCRSPMAEGILKKCAKEQNIDILVKSAGINSGWARSASSNAIKAADNMGIDISGHIPATITKEIVNEADLILTMTKIHKLIIIDNFDGEGKTYTINEYAYGIDKDVLDPYGGYLEEYKRCAGELNDSLGAICNKLRNE